jgi:hypothetical protein
MVNFSTSKGSGCAGTAKTKDGLLSLWGGFDPLGFKVWGLHLFPYYALNSQV